MSVCAFKKVWLAEWTGPGEQVWVVVVSLPFLFILNPDVSLLLLPQQDCIIQEELHLAFCKKYSELSQINQKGPKNSHSYHEK